MAKWWLFIVGGLAMVLWFVRKGWSFSQLEKSNTATKEGISNTIPADLRARAEVLGELAAYLESLGYRVTSAFRSHELTMTIRENNAARSGGAVATNTSAHTQARALDVGGRGGASTNTAEFAEIRAEILADPLLAPYIQKALIEGNHLHVQFRGDVMDSRGRLV